MTEKNKKDSNGKNLFKLLIVGFLMIISFEFGYERGADQNTGSFLRSELLSNNTERADLSLFWKAWDILHENYVDAEDLNSNELMYGAIDGMLQSTGDSYTTFLSPEERKQFDEEIEGSFEGIGAEIGIRDDVLTIIAPLQNSPAEQAGLRAGDKILKIEGESTTELNIDEAVKKIRGPKGTEVKLTIFRNDGSDESKEIKVTRDVIKLESVEFELKENNVSYIKMNLFGDSTAKEFNEAIAKMPKDTNGLILDLRNNPGGLLDVSIDVASRMIPKGEIVLIQENQKGAQKKLTALGGDVLSGIPTVVLINEGSASASEILAGALNDNRENVTIVGEKSFGKGSVQELIKLEKGAVKITVAKWLTPSGKQINDEGIDPEVEVELTVEDFENDRDPQLDKALEILSR